MSNLGHRVFKGTYGRGNQERHGEILVHVGLRHWDLKALGHVVFGEHGLVLGR